MTMALPLAFAACTSDEFESFNNQGEALKNRKDLGQVALMFEGDAQTRWTESLGAEVGDRVGAVLIDQLNDGVYDEEDPMSNYTISPSQVFSNYMYENDGTAWRTNANLVEGSYYFYAPYVAHQGRGLIKLNTPVVQTIDVDADGNIEPNSGIANFAKAGETPFVIGYKFLASTDDNTDVTISMKHLFAYPEIKFTNNSGEAVTLSRVLIQNTGDGFVASGELDNEAIGGENGKLFITGEQDRKSIEAAKELGEAYDPDNDPTGENKPEFLSWGAWSTVFAYDEGGQTIPDGLDNLTTADLLKNSASTELIRVDFSENVVVADKETISFRVIMPAGTYKTTDLSLWFVVPSGKAYEVAMEENRQSQNQITTMLQDRYTAQDYTSDGRLKTGAKQFEVAIDEDAKLDDAPSVVTTTEALIDLLEYEKSNTGALNVTLAGSDIEFNQDVLNAIANMESQSVEFSGLINIVGSKDAEKPMKIDQNVTFDQAVVKEGFTTFDKSGLGYGEVTIEKGATLTVQAAKTGGTITNKGNLVVGDATISSVVNYGSITFAGKGSIKYLTDNSGDEQTLTITVAEGAEYTYDSEAKYNVVNNGTLIIPANAKIAGDITNNGVIELKGAATNMGELTNNAEAEIKGGAITNNGAVVNKGTIDSNITNGEPTAAEVEKGVKFTITAEDGSTFLGKIEGTKLSENNSLIVEGSPIFVNVDNSKLTVEYEATELNSETELPVLVNGDAFVNVLTVKGIKHGATANESDIDFSANGLNKVVELNINGNIDIERGQTLSLPATLLTVNIESDSQLSYGKLTWGNTPAKVATINIASKKTLTILGGTIEGNAGKGVEFDAKTDKDGKNPGQVRNIEGTVTGCVNTNVNGSWWTGTQPVASSNAVSNNQTISMNGIYTLGTGSKISSINADVTSVKLVAGTGESDNAVTIARSLNFGKDGVELIIGAGVTATFGETANDYIITNLEKVIGEEGAVIKVKDATDKTYNWENGKWVEKKADASN